jgi:bifunctional DNA-binding transcriptional regulator/antitoxin component of YhaV-PrlF toxin-antitoxin module
MSPRRRQRRHTFEGHIVPKAHIRNGQLTVPLSEEIREKLGVREGDELEAHVFPGSLILHSASPVSRERAWERICAITDEVRPMPAQAAKPIERVEDEIAGYVSETRRAMRAARKHG